MYRQHLEAPQGAVKKGRSVMNEAGGAAGSQGGCDWRKEDRQADVNNRVDKNMLVQRRGRGGGHHTGTRAEGASVEQHAT